MRRACIVLALSSAAWGQSLEVYSEFVRVDPLGRFADALAKPREILSPAVARNAYASFRVVVRLAEGVPATLYFQQNPEAFELTVYKDVFGKGLRKVTLPYSMILPDPEVNAPKQTCYAFWLDVWVPASAMVERVRIQPVVKAGDLWLQYPMEVRVTSHVVPQKRPNGEPGIERNIAQDRALAKALKLALPAEGPGVEGHLRVRDFIFKSGKE